MKYGYSRFSAGIVGMVAILLALGSCGRERINPIDPSFGGSESLNPPGNIQATGDIAQIALRWNAVSISNLAGYGIWRSTSATDGYVRLAGDSKDAEVTTARTTFVDTTLDLTQSKIYFYKINTVDTGGRSSELSAFVSGEAQEDTRPPAAPTDVSAVTDVNTGRVTLTWTAPQSDAGNLALTGLAQYKVFRSKDSQNAFVLVATIPAGATTYVDADQLEVSAQYFYRISALDPKGNEGARSAVVSLTTAGTGVAAPSGLRATGRIGEISLVWNAVSDLHLLGYLVLRADATQGPFAPITGDTLFTTGQTTYIDKNVVADRIYFYRVQTVIQDPNRGLVRSEASPFVDGVSSADQSAPAAPSDLIVSLDEANFRRVNLSWTAPARDSDGSDLTGLSSFRIFRSRQTNTSFVLLATVPGTQVSYQDTTVELLTQYFYAISAADPAGNVGPRSASASVTLRGLIAPRNPVAVAGVQKITLSWTANTEPELTGYEVLRFTDPGQATPNATFNSVLTTFVDTPVVAGQTYVYRVRAVGLQGLQSDLSNFVSAQAEAPRPILSAPRTVQAAGGIGRVTISWAANAEPELTGYRVLRYSDPGQATPEATFSSVQTAFVDSPLVAGRTVVYRVQALGVSGGNAVESELSLFAAATVLAVPEDDSPPATPGAFAAVLRSATTIEVRWSAPTRDSNGGPLTGLSGFVIYRAVGTTGAGFIELARVDSTRRVYENSGLEFNTAYIYQITAVDARGNESLRSSSVTLTTATAGAAVASPTNLNVAYVGNVTPPRVELNWTPPAEFDSFLIQRAVVVAGSSTLTFTTLQLAQTGTTYNDTDIQSGTTYVYRISTNRSGQISDPSNTAIIQIP